MKRPWLAASVAAAQAALLVLYFRRTGLLVSPQAFLDGFHFPPHSVFLPARLFAVWAMGFSGALVAALWVALARGAGAAALARLGVSFESRLQTELVAAGLGLGGLALTVFVLCAARGLNIVSVALLGAVLFYLNRGRWRGRLEAPKFSLGAPLAAALGLAGVLLLFHVAGVLVPPSSFDEMDYQLSLPKLYQLNGGFVSTPFSHFSFVPKYVNLVYLVGLVSGGYPAAKFLALAFSLLACLTLYAFAAPRLGARAAALAALLFYFTPVVGNQFRLAAADLGTAYFELLGLFLLLRWREDGRRATLNLAAIFWGLALGSKYTALPDFAATLAALLYLCRKDERADALKQLPRFGLIAFALLCPWLIRSFVETGNPFNPLLSNVIPSSNFKFAGAYRVTVDYARGLGLADYFPLTGVREVLLLPWHIVSRHNDFNHDLGPVWLLLAPLAFLSLGRKRDRWLSSALLFAAAFWLVWLCGAIHMTRYFMGGVALAALGGGWILDAAFEERRWRWALLAPALFAWGEQSARMIAIQNTVKKPWGFLAGRASIGDYLASVQPDCPYDAIEFINDTAPKDARVLVFNEFRTFYLDRDFLASTPWDHDYWLEMIRTSRTPAELLAKLKERRVTYFLANDSFRTHQTGTPRADEWTTEDLANEKKLLLRVLQPLYRGGEGAWVARVREAPKPI